jgi:GPH family glycoside/pentoside/hexuronide:cation symporter
MQQTALATAPGATAAPPLTFWEKTLYGMGEGAEGVNNTALQTFLLFYYVQVVGMSGSLCGLALFLALLIDGFTDPIVGSWSDHFRSRLGRRHPFLYAAPIPLAIGVFLLFNPPHGLAQGLLFAWLLGFNLMCRVAMSLYYVPHMALGAELSDGYDERISLSARRMLFTQVGRIVCLGAAFTLFFVPTAHQANGQLNAQAYRGFAVFCGAAVVLFVITSALGTQRRVLAQMKRRPVDTTASGLSLKTIGVRFGRAMAIANFRRCFLALLVMYLFAGTQTVLVVHMNTYFWQFTPQQAQFTFYAQIFGFIVGLPLGRPLANLFDKKWAYCLCVGGACVLVSIPIFLRLLGWFPPNSSPMVLVWVALANLAYGVMGANSGVFSAAMLADIADQYELEHQARAEGLFFGAVSFSSKASIGLGGAFAGILLDLIHFPRPPAGGVPSALAVTRLCFAYGPVLLLLLLLGLSIMFGYDLTRKKHAAILEKLTARRGV